jgi:DNA-binding HxlR family transcriptional regulator
MSYNRPLTINCETNTDADCSVEAAMAILAGKWKLKIYKVIHFEGALRFSEIRDSIGRISEKTLTTQLREMEIDGIITRSVYPEVPPRVEYRLTELGESLKIVFYALDSFGKSYIKNRDSAKQVKTCG